MNQNWNRWIEASCTDYFETNKGEYNFCTEGDRVDKNKFDLWCDFYFIGPKIQELSRNFYRLDCTIQLVLTEVPNDQDAYRLQQMVGYFAALYGMIPVYRYGLTADDMENDQTLLGCLQLNGPVDTNVVGEETKLMQATVRADFRMYLEGDD